MSSTFLPSAARARASAPATVVLPVPPLPVTTCSRTPSQSVSRVATLGGYPRRDTRRRRRPEERDAGGSRDMSVISAHLELARISLGWDMQSPPVRGLREEVSAHGRAVRHNRAHRRNRIYRRKQVNQDCPAVRGRHHFQVREGPAGRAWSRADDHPPNRRQDSEG